MEKLKYLLLQVRNLDDPMIEHEIDCFARGLKCTREQICIFDLISGVPTNLQLDSVDMVLIGGSGDYSVAEGGDWLPAALDTMQKLESISKPTFASCWGFQAFARALGGEVVTDIGRAELGTIQIRLTAEGILDPIFGPLGNPFLAQMGHQDIVDSLPENAVLLASTERVTNEAFLIKDKPIYCTQFHPELDETDLLQRLRTYPTYIPRITGKTFDEIAHEIAATPESNQLLERFVNHVFG